jgi:hypothetical protein
MYKRKTTYDKLYLTILKIGQKKVHSGLSYNQLKKILIDKGYDFDNTCIELSVKQWFYDSFHHISSHEELKTAHDIDGHADCAFILKGESCLKLLSYKTSRYSFRNGIIALIVSFTAVSYTIVHNTIKDKSEIKPQNEKLTKIGNKIKETTKNR